MTLRRIDHVVVDADDLDAAAALYQSLGFQVGARNRHPWGTENRLIQFNSSFIELITIAAEAAAIPAHQAGQFSFGAFVRDYLRQREGLAMLVLDSGDAKADAALFARKGIGSFAPFFFERKGLRPDGSETHVAFTLAFAKDENAPEAGFFVCQQHFPENFWNPAFQNHENGARDIAAIGMTAAQPDSHEDFLVAFSGAKAQRDAEGGLSIKLQSGRLNVISYPAGAAALRLSSITIAVTDTIAQAKRLRHAGIRFEAGENLVSIPSEAAFGVEICFAHGEPN